MDFEIDKPIDDDYIDVEKERADVSTNGDTDSDDDLERSANSADRSHRFDTSEGSGSSSQLDELIDENAIIENDGRSETRTFFRPGEANESQQAMYERILRYQEGMWDSERERKNYESDRQRWLQIYSDRLDVPKSRAQRVALIIEGLNMSHMAHYSSSEVILATISLAENERGRFIRDEQAFRDLLRDIESTPDNMKKIRQLVREKSNQL